MKHFRFTAATLAVITAATSASADVTASDVWEQFQENYIMNPNAEVSTGSVNVDNNRVVVTDLTIQTSDNGIEFKAVIPMIDFQERGDGTVEILYAERSPFTIKGTNPNDPFEFGIDMVLTEMRYIVSGDPELMNFAVSGDEVAFELTKFQAPEEDVMGTGSIIMSGITGNSIQTKGNGFSYSGDANITSIVTNLKFQKRGDGTGGTITGRTNGLSFETSMMVDGDIADLQNSPENLKQFLLSGSSQSSQASINFDVGDGPFTMEYASQGATTDMGFDQSMFKLATSLSGMNFEFFDMNTLPFPVQVAMSELAFDMNGPLGKDSNDFGIGFKMADLEISEGLWNLFDPAQMFDRSPASLNIQISGVGQWFFNLMDPKDAAKMENADVPGQIESVKIDTLSLHAVGVTADGSGAFTFDNNDFMTFPGAPRPEGKAELSVTGINALMDTLMQMGFIGAEESMGMRMGMAMFTTPGPTEDSLTSNVEINAQGHVIVNGQRLR